MKFRVTDLDGDFEPFEVNGTELINYCRELRGENSEQEYPDPKNTKDAIKYLSEYCNLMVKEITY